MARRPCRCDKCLTPKATYIKELGYVLVELPDGRSKKSVPENTVFTLSVERAKSLSEKLRECVYGVEDK